MGLSTLAVWLGETQGSIALHESLYMYPLIETAHVLAIALFAGTINMVDLRLLGRAFTSTPVSEMTRRMLPWTVAGFVVLVITGLLLFYAIPVRTYHSLWFRLKLLLLVVAALNVWWLHRRVQRDRERWDRDVLPPRNARIAAGVSLLVWAGVIVAGRMIAYNWADCDRPQPGWIRWAAECQGYPGQRR
jgi:uncharacterized membrane protein